MYSPSANPRLQASASSLTIWARRLLVVAALLIVLVGCGSSEQPELAGTAELAATPIVENPAPDEADDATVPAAAAGVDDDTAIAAAAEVDAGDQSRTDDAREDGQGDDGQGEVVDAEDPVASADADVGATAPTIGVANDSFLGSYTLVSESFGTDVTVIVEGETRTIESNTLPNHETGEFPNSGNPNAISEQDRSWTLPTEPVYTGQASEVREIGVALNGVKFEPGTGESVQCASGENYRIEGLQSMFDLGMDVNNAHVQPTGEYHYHGVSEMLVDAFASDDDLVLVGFASDGHSMYYSKSSAFSASYELSTDIRSGTDCDYRGEVVVVADTDPDGTYVSDWVYVVGLGDLDECNGTTVGDEYAYVVTEEYPYIPRCLMGESTGAGGAGQGPGGQPPSGAPDSQDGQAAGVPDLADAAAALGLSETELQDLLGGPPPDVASAAAALGITEDELLEVLTEHGAAPPSS